MPNIPGLRSPYDRVGRLVYFGRMLDKIRLHAAGRLPPEYVANLGETNPRFFDARCCRFLGIRYSDLVARFAQGDGDEQLLAWAHAHGTPRSDEECAIWNAYMAKLGWRDEVSDRLKLRIAEYGLSGRGVETFFDMFDADEDRATGSPCS
jgi:gluconokinase